NWVYGPSNGAYQYLRFVDGRLMRCGSNLVSEGELIVDVIRKCGDPSQRRVVGPAVDANGYVAKGAATIENWVYGPSNGAYQYLRFVD
ncbi:DUF2845 domain-containing protein, partial [Pseudomonas plecoglossicida]|uniref:DUF2845 domain-containing protein n=1 Tax=Pseudomonas plecoglossicida TaxID=70775 RepID=UPI00356B73FF